MQELQEDVKKLLKDVSRVVEGIENQAEYTHNYWSAAADEACGTARDWAGIDAGVRSAIGMKLRGLPLSTDMTK